MTQSNTLTIAREKAAKALKEKGETPEELLRSIKENEAAVAEAQRVVDAWKAIVGEKSRREEASKAEAERIAAEKAEEEARVEAERKAEEERKTKEEERKERDENGQPFVVSSDGTTTFGEITEDTGLTAAPIKLSEGFQDANTGKGYGLVHIEANHGEQIRQAGFTSVKEFVSFVATHYDPDNIRVGKRRDDGSDTFLIQVTDTHDNTLFIELSKDGSYWNVNSGGIFRKGYSNKKETVAKTEPQQPTNAVSRDSSLSANVKDGITNAEPNGEPTVSLDKGTTLPADQQTSDKENTKKVADSEGENTLKAKIEAASADVNTEPTEAQKEAGNYKKGHVQVGAFDITIEQPEGSIRRGTDADGKKWEIKMHNTYGYFRGTEGVDGDHIDVFLSNDIDGWNGRKVFVVDQYNPDGTFDEHKVMLGFNDMDEAKSDYLANYEKGWENGRRITVSTTNLEDFEKWIDSSHRKTKPFSEYSSVNKETVATDKGGEKAEKKQKKQSVFDKAKEIADKEEKKRKAEADSVLGQATRAVGKKKKVNLFKYTASEKNSNSALRGVHYANGYAYASDGYILFKEKADYPKEWEGTTRDKDGNLIDGKYPDAEKAIPRLVHIPDKEVESLPSKEVLDFAIAASKKLKGEAIPVAIDGLFFNAVNLKKFLEAVASKGMDKIVYRYPMLYATNGKDEIVMMPTVNTLEGTLDIADKMERAGLPKEQIDAWKAHIEAADKKMSFEDFQNAEKNAKRKGVRLTEAESPKRKADERYQRGEGGVKPSKAEVALRDAVIDRLRESGMDVIADEAEGQRVLDEVNGRAKVQMGDAPETFAERQKQAVESHGVVMPGLNESYVEVVKDIPRHEYTGSIAEATREAIDAAKRKYAGKELTYNNYGANFNYTISANAIDICLSPKHQNLSANKGIHLALAEHLDEVINKSVEVEEHPDYIKGKDGKRGEEVNPNAIMHRFYGVAVIDGTPCRVMTLMREDGRSEEANGVHSYEVQKIEVLDNESPSTSNGVGTQMKDLSAYPLAKLLKGVEKSYDKGKYLLDESKKRSVGLREQRVDGADGVRFFRTANGEAYGFTVGGRIYIDPRIATSETPVHEYAHLWAEALRNGNPKEWQNVVELMKGTKVWDEVKARYPELKSDDEIADEVIATYSGRRGAERLREEQRKIAEGNGGVFEKAEAVNALERVKQALKKFWNGVADFLHIHYKSAEEVADRVMKDLLEGVDPRKMGKTKDGGVRFSAKQKRALETASLGNVPRSLTVVSSAAGANVLNNIENLAKEFEKSATQPKTFIGDVAKALGASRFGSGSEYATFETKNGNIVTIRLANHNAHVYGFDHNDKDNGISIVISPKPNEGITNDGNAHITEFYYDSIKLRRAEGKPLAEIVRSIKQALYSGEFKDTTGLAERQEVNGEDVIRYQSSSENSDKTLAGVHNITEEKLRKALKLGGLANPSVAVIDISKNSHEGFGEISLILPSEKVAKRTGKNAGTWQGDAWTPTYPQIERRMSNKGAEKASKDVLSVPSDMYSEVRIGLDRWLDSGEANSAMAYMFLHEKGVAPEPKKIQPKFSDEAYNELKSITAGNFNIYGISKADAQKVLAMYIDAYFDGDKDLYEDKTKAWLEKNRSIVDAGDKGGMRYAIAKENVKLYDEYGFNYRGVQTFVRDVEYDHRNTGVDMNATLNEVEDYIKTNSLTDEFNTWQEGKEKEYGIKEVIFDGFTPSGNRRYIPNTLENVSKIMKKQGRNGATGAWASFPNFAARLMPSYGTLEDIRSKKGLLTSDREKIDDFREKWSKVFFELGMKCQPDATGTFDDYGFDRLSEAAMTSDPQAFLKQEYNVDFSDEDTKRLKKMVKAIKEEYPAMYFETKFERPVYLNEFAAVVVPNDLGADVKKALSDLGIAMYEYDASKEGDRSRAFDEAVKSSGKIRFQFIGEKGAAEADHAEEVFANENVERSVRESRSEKTDLTAEERELRDNLVERMRKGGLDVVTDSEEMQRVIDTENERTRNMFVGEKGATEADKAEEVSTRLDNLSVARGMEEAKKDAKTIKMATGWERGTDGKWRYETSDIKPKPFEEWMNKKNLKLGDIIDSDSGLFEMYPELKDFKVTRGKGKSTNAAIYTGLGKIEINFSKFKPYMSIPSNREKINGILHRVINHEIQHAIQDSEGFAQGVSPNAFRPDAPIGKLREMEEADGRMVERYNAMSYTEKALGEGVRLKERILENRKEYNALASKYRFGMDGYTRAAGEVEARNTEKRIGMTEEERKASLASETEDVAREDQILLGVDNADEEVNTGSVREHRVYHGSGADFDSFDHSHMGEGEGAQAYGWGTYVTEVEGIGRTYAIQNTTTHNDALRALQHDVDAISDQLNRHRDDLKYDEEQLKRANEWRAEAELDYELFRDEAEELKEKYGESSPKYRNHLFNDIYTDEMKRAQSSVKSMEESIQYRKEKIAELEKALKDKQAEIDELPKEFPRHLYTVEIPDDNGGNYLDWNGHPAESLLKDVGSFLEGEGFERVQDSPVRYEKGESTVVLNQNATGADLYAELQKALGSDKKASQALAELGCIGIKYPADNMRGGREDGAKNYVIFNENDAKITDHTRFLRTAGGEVYGLVKDGRIYLDPKVATAETAVHEYTHLWGDMLRRKDSEQWNHTVKELKNSVLWEEVKESYPELKTDDEIADEVLSTFSGRRGAERLREEARRVADGEGGVFTKAKAIETLERVKETIARFWEGVARMFGINRYRSAEELADMAMKDLLDSKNPMKDESGMRKRGEVGETLATSGTYFSGGGLLEAGLKGVIDPKVAVEFSEKIAGVYADNHGNHIVVADVRDVDPKKLVGAVDGGEVQYFHASPVCKNFSKAKREGGEVELDKETALSTAEFIAKTRPKVVTIENVKGYRNSEALKIITDELTRQGYDWDADVYNAADYGGYTKRERLIVRAKRDGKLPPKPEKLPEELRKKGWYSAVEDLIPHLEEKKTGVPQGTDERLKNSGIDYRTIDKPLYVFGRGYANKTVGHAFADELLPTLTTGGGDIIIMPDGRVLKASPRVLARVTGLPDTYKMPETDQLSHTIVGNGIPTQLTEGVIAPLLDNAIPSAERATKRESVFDVADRVSQNLEERTRNMFVGEKGATEADKAEEVSTRLDNLSVARRMEEAKKDAKAIKMATGWERGTDGKWRYETGDAKIKDTIELDGKTFKRYEEDMLWTSGKFGDVVDAPELFKAYPELRDVRIETDAVLNDMPSNGEYNPRTNTITIHSDDLKYQNSILNHEIQHAIQHIEGFETGGSAENVRERIQQIIDNSSDEVGYARERLREWADLNAMAAMLDVAYRKFVGSGNEWERAKAVEIYWDAINTIEDNDKAELAINYPHDKTPREVAESGYLVDDVIRELNRLADETRKEIPDGDIDTMRKVDRLVGALKDKTDFELYNRLAGEVEARNTEKRIGMTEEERRASLASETEDVAREDQILLRQGLDGINIMRSEAAATPLKGDEALTALDSIFGENEGSAIPPKISSFAKFKNLFKKPVRTFLGELVQVKDEVWNKILRNNRQDITGTVLPTIENADFAIRDTDGSTLYVKRFKGNGQERMYNVVVVNKHGEVEDYISSVHIKRDNNLRNKIKKGAELFLPNARTTDGTMSRNNSTPGAKVANYSETAKPRYSRKPGESIFDYASRVSEDVDRSVREIVSARDEYEKKVKSKGFQTKEALQNSMLGLQEFMYAIDRASGNKRYIEDIPDFENPILGENRLSSVNKEEMHQVAKTQFKPLMSAVAKLSGNGKESGELYDYMFAKHGLERDAVMRQREAQKEFDKYQKANPKGTKTIGDFVASLEGKDYAGLTALTAEDGRVKSIQSQIDAIDEQMKATDDQLLLRKLGGQKKRLKVDLLNAARDAADDIRKAFENNPSHDRSDINELWSRVNEVNGNTLRKLYESGMLTKEAYNDISSMYTNYIPMRGFDQTTSADAYAYLTHGDSAFNAPIKTAKGRSSKADNPIAYMQAMAESAIMQGNRNVLVKQKMLNFVRNHPSDLASVSDVWLQYDSVADEWKPFYAFGRESKG